VRERGGIAIIIAHRPAALSQATHVLFMREGRGEAFGERDEVLRRLTRPANAVVTTAKEA
jgi:ATP-binding cassette subfamily C protein